MHGAIKFNEKAWLKPYIDMNTELRKMQRMISIFFQANEYQPKQERII